MSGTLTIREGAPVTTFVNVFTVRPERQRELLETLADFTEKVVRHCPGFIGASFHGSDDGTRVVNYAQWESAEDLRAMLDSDEARPYLRRTTGLAEHVDPHTFTVSTVHPR
ncbi:antibiotic biosynthesis monooxygenase family protein [Streptomyces sp. NPDC048172]|uniref:antibiotic biosynthesis monooxygenase family protein n=1 Tax=Streptomyces sp. NPDC048172 TaxID=3365505 RepID=UPI00371B45EE